MPNIRLDPNQSWRRYCNIFSAVHSIGAFCCILCNAGWDVHWGAFRCPRWGLELLLQAAPGATPVIIHKAAEQCAPPTSVSFFQQSISFASFNPHLHFEHIYALWRQCCQNTPKLNFSGSSPSLLSISILQIGWLSISRKSQSLIWVEIDSILGKLNELYHDNFAIL